MLTPRAVVVATSTSFSVETSKQRIVYRFIRLIVSRGVQAVRFNNQADMIRKLFILFVTLVGAGFVASAQKTALVDMEYILGKIPAYEMMNRQLEDVSKKWQSEVSALETEAQTMYKKFQADIVFLSAEQKKSREEAIIAKEKATYELKRKYFGPEGELVKRRESLMKPIQDEVWKALKELAISGGYQLIFDRSSGQIVYADPAADVSALVLERMGYGK